MQTKKTRGTQWRRRVLLHREREWNWGVTQSDFPTDIKSSWHGSSTTWGPRIPEKNCWFIQTGFVIVIEDIGEATITEYSGNRKYVHKPDIRTTQLHMVPTKSGNYDFKKFLSQLKLKLLSLFISDITTEACPPITASKYIVCPISITDILQCFSTTESSSSTAANATTEASLTIVFNDITATIK